MAFHKKIEQEWFSIDDLCKKYGVSRTLIISQIKSGKLKAMHPGKTYRIHKEWLEEWEKNNMYKVA